MHKLWISMLTVSWLLFNSAAASAQEKGQTGLTIAFPASVGLIWHVSDRVALRPDVSFSLSKSSPDASIITLSDEGSSFAVGLSGLFYVRKWEGLRTYVSPRFSYSRTSTTVTTTISGSLLVGVAGGIPNGTISTSSSVSEYTSSGYFVSGSFGAQYSLSRKFGVFGEAGLGYDRHSSGGASTPLIGLPGSIGSTGSTGSTAHGFGTRAGVGVLFYF